MRSVCVIVERSFSKQGFIHSDLRNKLKHELVEAQMMISFNEKPLNETSLNYMYEMTEKQIELKDAAEENDDDLSEDNDSEEEHEEEHEYKHKTNTKSHRSAPLSLTESSTSSSSSSSSLNDTSNDALIAMAASGLEEFRYVCTRSGRQTRQKLS
jgi:hypothetical protein